MRNRMQTKNPPGSGPKPIFHTMLMSDLHLEHPKAHSPEFSLVPPILILAADIGRPDITNLQKFLLAQCARFEHFFYVAGNHCFYQAVYETRLKQLRELNNLHPRIHFLQQNSDLLPNNVRILGTILWSHIRPASVAKVSRCMNDYRYIETVSETETKAREMTVDDTNAWHAEQHAWLLQEIDKARKNREHLIIITHHAPSRRNISPEEHTETGVEDAFVNDHDAGCLDPARLWVYEHTHQSTDLMVSSTRIVSNQLGYAHERSDFRPNMRVTLYDDGTLTVTDTILE